MNQDEIAEILQTSASTISRRLKRAQEKLRDVLKGGREDE
jgi:RNA polymerase sigma-70 factor (ECF subfamily)